MGIPLRTLIIEDSEDDALLVVRTLRKGGYDPAYERVETADAMGEALERETWDIIISDYKMPHFSGLAALKLYKEKGLVIPFILVSGTIGEEVAVEAMKNGAHDYVMKNNLPRLVPAVQRELREAESRRELKQAEEKLKKSESLLKEAQHLAHVGHWGLDPAIGTPTWSEEIFHTFGLDPEQGEPSFENHQKIIHPDDWDILNNAITQSSIEGTPFDIEFRIVRPDKSIRWMNAKGYTTRDNEGKIVRLFGTAQDITERKQTEETLLNEKQKFLTLLDNAPFGMVMISQNGTIGYTNQKFREIFGYESEDIPDGRTWFRKAYPDAAYRHEVISAWKDDLEKGRVGEQRPRVFTTTCKDGSTKIINFIPVLLVTGDNLMVCEDITERKRIEESLFSEKQLSDSTINSLPGIFYLFDDQGGFQRWNKNFEEVSGYSAEEIARMHPLNLFTGEDRQLVEQTIQEVFTKGEDTVEAEFVSKDGRRTPYLFTGVRITIGNTKCLIGMGIDITKRKQAEASLRQSEAKYRSIFENSVEGIFQTTPEGRYTSVNPALAMMIGYDTPEELIKGVTDLSKQGYVNPEDRIKYKEILEGQGIIREFETQHYKKDGSMIWVSINARAVKDAAGKILYYEGIIGDITSRKLAEERIVTEKQRFLSLVDNAPFGMIMVNQEGIFQYYNPKFEEMFGYTLYDTPNGKTWVKKAYPDPAYRHSVISTWKADIEKLKAKEHISETFEVTCKDGSRKVVNFIPVQMESGQLLVACNDITSRIEAEEAFKESFEKLQKATSAIIDVIVMAVEMKDPYTSGHQKRVTKLAIAIATDMGLPSDLRQGIHMAGMIHDLGKISIPAEILSMPRKLNDLEFNLIKTHPQTGYDMLKDIDFDWPIAQMVYQHHEMLDGSGYPNGLKGEAILLEAKILTVADVVEAMASHRPYRASLGLDVALKEIEDNAGILYDSNAVDACVRLFRERGFKFE